MLIKALPKKFHGNEVSKLFFQNGRLINIDSGCGELSSAELCSNLNVTRKRINGENIRPAKGA